jgi:hypothetical protein
MKQYQVSYRGLSPHQFMPMTGVHPSFQPMVLASIGARLNAGVMPQT